MPNSPDMPGQSAFYSRGHLEGSPLPPSVASELGSGALPPAKLRHASKGPVSLCELQDSSEAPRLCVPSKSTAGVLASQHQARTLTAHSPALGAMAGCPLFLQTTSKCVQVSPISGEVSSWGTDPDLFKELSLGWLVWPLH